jgi:hypothetical protein
MYYVLLAIGDVGICTGLRAQGAGETGDEGTKGLRDLGT